MHLFVRGGNAVEVVNADGEAGLTWNGTASTDDA
jgi:hypothetical protein